MRLHRAIRFVFIQAVALWAAVSVVSPSMAASSAQPQDLQKSCEPGSYPDDGNFEVAEITEKTPAIIDLPKKQFSDQQLYAEAGTVVVIWRRREQYVCVQSPMGIPDTDFWVHQKSLRLIPENPREDRWVGSYGWLITIEIKQAGPGAYDVFGEREHTQGHGPGWGYTISNQIFAHESRPRANAIEVTLKRDVSTAGPKAPKSVTSPGVNDERCKPMLFVKGPVLMIKDTGDCGDGSVFQGFWLRNP